MKWYLTKLVFKITHQPAILLAEFDEQYRLVQANNEEEAFIKAKIIGVKNELSFENTEGNTINWSFIDVAYLKEIDTLTDGMELFSTTHTAENAEDYVQFIHHQSELAYRRVIPHAVTID